MTRLLSTSFFRSLKPHNNRNNNKTLHLPKRSSASTELPISLSSASLKSPESQNLNDNSKNNWCVYLILSTNSPIKTYVGATNNFCRRLKQHNGELKGGAKASQAGRPWICACIIRGFETKSDACKFEFRWKNMSRKMTRERNSKDEGRLRLLQHRNKALQKVKGSINCINLEFDWKLELI
uniref:structure-specific endonuclease subunit SLX1 n=1 Tax=Erigeron canadensis TaxID=72917 RepID=UPI001CB94ECB|nr:structure-specific endonuclease subunit SLX1 [Erigeron canadensis]